MQHAPCAHLGGVSVVRVWSTCALDATAIEMASDPVRSSLYFSRDWERHTALVDEHLRRLLVRIRLEVIESGGEEEG